MTDDNSLHEKPAEFLQAMTQAAGTCDAQAVLPAGDHYEVSCSCGAWRTEASSRQEGLTLARRHTSEVEPAAIVDTVGR
jgi:hypothetical protein